MTVCTPKQVRQALPGHEVHTVVKMGWGELENGDLLRKTEAAGFNPLIICDKNLRHQQKLAGGGWRFSNCGRTIARRWSSIGR